MSDYLIKGETLTGIADAIRAKTGGTDLIMVSDMANQIGNITGGGGSSETVIKEESDVTGFALDADFGYMYMDTAPSFHLEVGKTYRIVWDDKSWTCTAETITMDGFGSFACVGDLSGFGLSSNGEPFAIASSKNTLMYTALMDDKPEHKVAIYEVASGGSSDDVRYVTFLNYDGSYLGKKAVAVGDDCADPIARGAVKEEDLVKPETAEYKYTHDGWATSMNGSKNANALDAVEEDRTVYAFYKADKQRYIITFLDSDGSVLYSDDWEYGETPAHMPEKDGYTFTGWTPSVVAVTGTATYTATWTKPMVLNDYTWTQLDAMTADEMKSKFKVGDKKYLTGSEYAVLVGFEHDDLADGSGKAKATFITTSSIIARTNMGQDSSTSNLKYWDVSDLRAHYTGDKMTAMFTSEAAVAVGADKIHTVAKTVKKRYCANYNNGSVGISYDKFWAPSMTELGYAYEYVPVEGARYEYFAEKTSATTCEFEWNSSVRATRSIYLGSYSNAGFKGWFMMNGRVPKVTKGYGTLNSDTAYPVIAFCI